MIRTRRTTPAAAVPLVPADGEGQSQVAGEPKHAAGRGPRQPDAPRSRRALMTGTVAAGAGVATAFLVRAQPAEAADGGSLVLGAANSASQATSLANDGADGTTLDGLDVTAAQGNGVQGTTSADKMSGLAGVDESPDGGAGVSGNSNRGTGVSGTSSEGPGVTGKSTDGPGVTGTSVNGFGVTGSSEIFSGVFGTTTNANQGGVFGYDQCPTGANGVIGDSDLGTGVSGNSTSGTGVLAASPSGTALKVEGAAAFSRSGVASVPAGQRSVTVTLAGVAASSLVLVTLQKQNPTAPIWVIAAVPGTGSFTIFLSSAARVALPVAWIVFEHAAAGSLGALERPRVSRMAAPKPAEPLFPKLPPSAQHRSRLRRNKPRRAG